MRQGDVAGLSRREIDALVSEIIDTEDGQAVRPTPERPPRSSSSQVRWGAILVWAVIALIATLGFSYGNGRDASSLLSVGRNPNSLLGGVPAHPTDSGDSRYAFLYTQPNNPNLPIGYNPCRSIGVEINYLNATPDILALTQATIRQLNRITGMHLVYAGASQQYRRTQTISGRILISFNDIPHDPSLQDAAGNGGSGYYLYDQPQGTTYYNRGDITLNTAEFNHYSRHDQALVLAHEFGHALGLGHVEGTHQVMDPGDYSVKDWGAGDLTGLAKLGHLPCQ